MLPKLFWPTERKKKCSSDREKLLKFEVEDLRICIPNGCLDAYEVKVNIDIFKYQEKVKPISQFQRFLKFFNGLLVVIRVCFIPIK